MATTEFMVLTASEKLGGRKFGRYGRVALVEAEAGITPKMISARARGLVRIIFVRDSLNIGLSPRCAFAVARAEAEEMARSLTMQRASAAAAAAAAAAA
jgi:hypothetical protein